MCYNNKVVRQGPLVKRLRHRPLTAKTWVRFPYGSPKEKHPNNVRMFFFWLIVIFQYDIIMIEKCVLGVIMRSSLSDNLVVIRLDIGDNIVECVKSVSLLYDVKSAIVSGIGATDKFTCGVFNPVTREYRKNHFVGTYEILSLFGNITRMNDEPYVHLHITVGDDNCASFGGHLIEARISATAEIFLQLIDQPIDRFRDNDIGLNLLSI